jgi:trehalose-phosphatase
MKHLNKHKSVIFKKSKKDSFFIFLDFDGTLVPIRKNPAQVRLAKRTKNILKRLADKDNMNIAVVSGRELDDIKKKIALGNIIYVGNHGFEISGPDVDFILPAAKKAEKWLKVVKEKLREQLTGFKGVIIEDKKFSLSVHYRMAGRMKTAQIVEIISSVTAPYLRKHKIRLTKGKKVREIRPPVNWNKGRAVEKILKLGRKRTGRKRIPLCIGDDRTDEDIFRLLKNRGYTVKVVKKPDKTSSAEYYLRNTGEVKEFLSKLAL